jgi:hypothetical protein
LILIPMPWRAISAILIKRFGHLAQTGHRSEGPRP